MDDGGLRPPLCPPSARAPYKYKFKETYFHYGAREDRRGRSPPVVHLEAERPRLLVSILTTLGYSLVLNHKTTLHIISFIRWFKICNLFFCKCRNFRDFFFNILVICFIRWFQICNWFSCKCHTFRDNSPGSFLIFCLFKLFVKRIYHLILIIKRNYHFILFERKFVPKKIINN